MTKFILLVMLYAPPVPYPTGAETMTQVHTQEFDSEGACNGAADLIEQGIRVKWQRVTVRCVAKGAN